MAHWKIIGLNHQQNLGFGSGRRSRKSWGISSARIKDSAAGVGVGKVGGYQVLWSETKLETLEKSHTVLLFPHWACLSLKCIVEVFQSFGPNDLVERQRGWCLGSRVTSQNEVESRLQALKEASRLYTASWVRDIGPELGPNDYKMKEESGETFNGEKGAPKEREPSTLEDLAVAAGGGMETLKPALQRVYMTRASAYRDALRSFIEGYQECIQQVMEKEGKSQQ